jgi:hypothetical protein
MYFGPILPPTVKGTGKGLALLDSQGGREEKLILNPCGRCQSVITHFTLIHNAFF